jgi:uncharacterized RDD family membrane protein YckC
MDFFLSIDGEKQGPVSLFKVSEWIESGRIGPDTLGWHRDLDEWKPIREIPALESVVGHLSSASESAEADEDQPEEGAGEGPPGGDHRTAEPAPAPPPPLPSTNTLTIANPFRTRPFTRFWSRMIDYTLVSVCVFLVSDVEFPQPQPGESFSDLFARILEVMQAPEARALARTQFLALIGWHVLEALLLHYFGTTPGKAILGVRVRSEDGGRLSIGRALGRSFYVYVMGMGLYLNPLMIIGMVFSFFRLMITGRCLWDQHLGTRVEVEPLNVVRIVLAIGALFGLLLLQSVKYT